MKTQWEKQAAFSACRQYRWWLSRTRETGAGDVVFVGLNPSTADADSDDPTCRRLMGFTEAWGFCSMVIVNTNPHISTDPKNALVPSPAVLDENLWHICDQFKRADLIVCAWGNHVSPRHAQRIASIPIYGTSAPMCFGRNKNGTPKHPLYLPKNCQLEPFA